MIKRTNESLSFILYTSHVQSPIMTRGQISCSPVHLFCNILFMASLDIVRLADLAFFGSHNKAFECTEQLNRISFIQV